MLEKVSSDLLSAKLDSLLTIAVGCVVFGMKGLYTYLQPLWIAIRKEVCCGYGHRLPSAFASLHTGLPDS